MAVKLVAPSILSADFSKLKDEVDEVLNAGADWIHVDVMDGHFVPNITIGPPVVKSLRPVTNAPLDVHLMIERPEKYIEDFAKAGADYITIHQESTDDVPRVLRSIRELGCQPGITLKPATPLESILPYVPEVDLVLVMTVNPGFSGQSFMADQVKKINQLRKLIDAHDYKALIEVDGGINNETARQCDAADVFVSGNFVFKAEDYASAISSLKGQL